MWLPRLVGHSTHCRHSRTMLNQRVSSMGLRLLSVVHRTHCLLRVKGLLAVLFATWVWCPGWWVARPSALQSPRFLDHSPQRHQSSVVLVVVSTAGGRATKLPKDSSCDDRRRCPQGIESSGIGVSRSVGRWAPLSRPTRLRIVRGASVVRPTPESSSTVC